jgi:hypothetical protein
LGFVRGRGRSIPALTQGAPIRDDNKVQTALVGGAGFGGSTAFRVRFKSQPNPDAGSHINWHIQDTAYALTPMRFSYKVRAADAAAIGRRLLVVVHEPGSLGKRLSMAEVTLAADWGDFSISLPPVEGLGGAKIQFTAGDYELGSDLAFFLDELRLDAGFSSEQYAKRNGYRYVWLVTDNGQGAQRWIKIGSLDPSGHFNIPPDKSLIICDDAKVFEERFGAEHGFQVFQLKNANPEWFFKGNSRPAAAPAG